MSNCASACRAAVLVVVRAPTGVSAVNAPPYRDAEEQPAASPADQPMWGERAVADEEVLPVSAAQEPSSSRAQLAELARLVKVLPEPVAGPAVKPARQAQTELAQQAVAQPAAQVLRARVDAVQRESVQAEEPELAAAQAVLGSECFAAADVLARCFHPRREAGAAERSWDALVLRGLLGRLLLPAQLGALPSPEVMRERV